MALPQKPRALIIGGSVGGLFAAHCLRKAGWDALIFERSRSELADRGACIGTQPPLYDVMAHIGVNLDPTAGVASNERVVLDAAGQITHHREAPSIASAWDRIYRPLRAAVPDEIYRRGMRLDSIEQQGDTVVAVFEDGGRECGDLLVAADGGQSTVRGLLAPAVAPQYAGYVAWRGVIDESDMTPSEHALLFGRMSFCLPQGELLLGLGMPGRDADARPGRRRYYWIWFRPAPRAEDLRDLCTDATGHCHGVTIPPHLVRPELLEDLRAAAPMLYPPDFVNLIGRTKWLFPNGIFDLDQDTLVFGRVALLGDAAFGARPHAASGLTKAALDAQALGAALGDEPDIDAALARYERERLAFGKSIIARARSLGAHLEASAKGLTAPPHDPQAVLRDYGTAGAMR